MFPSRLLALCAVVAISLSVGCKKDGGGDTTPSAPTCTDGTKNGGETGVDCGGATCVAAGKTCGAGVACIAATDCGSAYCNPSSLCSVPGCPDGWQNGDETDVDCGGSCATKCALGGACVAAADCASDFCNPTGHCSAPSCTDTWKNGLETAVDCGGATCVAAGKTCADGYGCTVNADCFTGFCNASDVCGTATCTDGAKNGLETGVDCGGTTCVSQGYTCADDSACSTNADCTHGFCNASNLCKTPTCIDTVKNGTETAVDCGGAQCDFEGKTCSDGQACAVAADCASGYCTPALACATPSCSDAWQNGAETGLNCGGGTCPDCAIGRGCAGDGDCASGFCNPATHLCAAPGCSDTWKNGTETDVDCGGTCTTKCAAGFDCGVSADCTTGLVCDPTTKTCSTQCKSNGVSCTATGDNCCTGYCDDVTAPLNPVCADPINCTANTRACAFNSECCTDFCDPTKVCANPPVCRGENAACSQSSECCADFPYCNPSSRVCSLAVSACLPPEATCSIDEDCCSSDCDNPTHGMSTGHCTPDAFCKVPGAACLSSPECCSITCTGGVCLDTKCKPTGTAVTSATECCTGTRDATTGLCAILPAPSGTSACSTLGDTCNPAADTCCSLNCQGDQCVPAFICHAPDDICYRDQDCCSGKCTTTTPGVPGRCLAPTGVGAQGGSPCTGPTTCVTRICTDLGSGQAVCKPAGGCRMTDDYCNANENTTTTACTSATYRTVCGPLYGDNSVCRAGFCTNPNGACCGGTPDKVDSDGYGVVCAPKQVNAPTICSNGQSCNPPGNICGAFGDNASQNCCTASPQIKGQDVCKRDLQGIARCFGGGSSTCPTGYDGANPACCIGTDPGSAGFDNVCQFRDQCCNFVPCVPDANGILRCTPPTCTAQGLACSGLNDGACCAGTVCTLVPDTTNFTCEPPPNCTVNGNGCAANGDCCSNNCAGGFCAPPCASTGATCTYDGDCCSGLACNIPAGSMRGTCESVSQCAPTGGGCNVNSDCCNSTASPAEECIEGACAVPAVCLPQFTSCTSATAGDCCAPTSCIELNGTVCPAGSNSCSCDFCSGDTGACDPTAADTGCCVGLTCLASGTPGVGTCSTCVLAGDSCAASTDCCPNTSGGPAFVCGDRVTGEVCPAGGDCACGSCLLTGNSCTAGGAPCCGGGFCTTGDFGMDCQPGDLDCLCSYSGG